MTAWTEQDLTRIGGAEELQLASQRPRRHTASYVTIWVVRAGNDPYVRAPTARATRGSGAPGPAAPTYPSRRHRRGRHLHRTRPGQPRRHRPGLPRQVRPLRTRDRRLRHRRQRRTRHHPAAAALTTKDQIDGTATAGTHRGSVSNLCLGTMMFGDWGTKDHDDEHQDHSPRPGRRHQFRRHRRRLLPGRVRGHRRQGTPGPPRRHRARHQVLHAVRR